MATVAHTAARKAEGSLNAGHIVPAPAAQPDGAVLPVRVRYTVFAVLGTLLLGAAWLVAVRGPAILLDLSGMASLFCL